MQLRKTTKFYNTFCIKYLLKINALFSNILFIINTLMISENIAIGYSTLASTMTGSCNIALGYSALICVDKEEPSELERILQQIKQEIYNENSI